MFLTIGCFAVDTEDKDHPPYIEHVVAIFRDAANQIEKELGLECIGSGGAMPRDVERIDLKFMIYQRATVEQARELEVKATEKLVKIINAHEKIRPFLREFPSPVSRTGVSISFYKKNNHPYMDGSVAYCSQIDGRIYYRAEDPNNPDIYKEIKDEPYEEALRIIQENATKNPQPLIVQRKKGIFGFIRNLIN
jgi:hypothetical protein